MPNRIDRVRAELGETHLRGALAPPVPVGPLGIDIERRLCEAHLTDGSGQARIAGASSRTGAPSTAVRCGTKNVVVDEHRLLTGDRRPAQ